MPGSPGPPSTRPEFQDDVQELGATKRASATQTRRARSGRSSSATKLLLGFTDQGFSSDLLVT
eukprot:CAMPEP_0197415348 /NCGR_PEP_ID=MMETSP1170-20131217/1899_1 /TAXON_ID=54406 /ORGANISM="Sarcinochrysis sp, Strain CCMP770" /LENGTH=62 /DNA_ID=CAMNT_0042942139 /DNA_START=426 /DNA_END=610 /DNA_ORIENTATION=-